MLRLADRAYCPANASPELRRSYVRIMSRPDQAGLYQAVADLIGHRPGGCAECRPLPFSAHGRMLLDILGARNRTGAGRLLGALSLTRHVVTHS
jgi:hypothetical protein